MTIQGPQTTFEQQLEIAQKAVANNDLQSAFKIFASLQKLAPQRGDICFYYGLALLGAEEFDAAIAQLSLACQFLPQQHEPLFTLADAFEAVNSISDVETVVNFALRQFPDHPEVLYRAANFNREVGQLPQADKLACKCIAQSTDILLTSYAWLLRLNLNQALELAQVHDALVEINKKIPKLNIATAKQKQVSMVINYALGRYYELKEQENDAFTHWKAANQLQLAMCTYRVKNLSPLFNAIIANSSRQPQDSAKTISFTPIFIVGLLRTGSTLLEQMLCSHSDVSSLGEQALVADQAARFISHHTQQPYPLFLSELNSVKGSQICQQAAKVYEKSVKKRQRNSPFVIDKLPANFQSIGLIKLLFPHAKIIHLSRQFADTGLSIFKNHFAANEPYLCDLAELSVYRQLYRNLMQHWRNIYKEEIFEISYESLVSKPQQSIEHILSFCGLSHQNACWRNEENKTTAIKIVKTLSSAQVTAPIHQRAIGQHIGYADHLKNNGLVSD